MVAVADSGVAQQEKVPGPADDECEERGDSEEDEEEFNFNLFD